MDEVFLLTNVELSSEYEEKFSKDYYPFGSNNFHFKIYVYNLTPYSTIAVSSQKAIAACCLIFKLEILFIGR